MSKFNISLMHLTFAFVGKDVGAFKITYVMFFEASYAVWQRSLQDLRNVERYNRKLNL